ncbi:MAG: hypothetical protein ACK5Z1_03030, partial [Gemmatimonadota bacterium]
MVDPHVENRPLAGAADGQREEFEPEGSNFLRDTGFDCVLHDGNGRQRRKKVWGTAPTLFAREGEIAKLPVGSGRVKDATGFHSRSRRAADRRHPPGATR